MIRVGLYDAYDKWEILCRSWANPALVTDLFVDKWDRPVLPHWQALASWGGNAACIDYIEAKLLSLRSGVGAEPHSTQVNGAINRELLQLAERLGESGRRDLARKFGQTITSAGFLAPFDDGLSPQLIERLREVFKSGALSLLRWADERNEIPSIEVLRTRAGRFPVDAIKRKRKVLSLFPALYYGRNDVIHIHDIGPDHVTLVDSNADALNDIQLIYPRDWTYICTGFEQFLNQAAERRESYDLIVSDPPKALGVAAAWDMLPTIMGMCSDTYITNYFTEMFDQLGVAHDDLDGLSRAVRARTGVDVAFTEMMERNSTVCWAVMRKRGGLGNLDSGLSGFSA
jgi:hypothetical protein